MPHHSLILRGEVRVTPWRAFPSDTWTQYRIFQRQTPFGMFQSHEWRTPTGETRREPWIPTPCKWSSMAVPVDDPDFDPLVQALELIAAGHNDPRRLAVEALEVIRGAR